MLAGLLDDFKDALMTGCAGTSRPANLQAGGMWVDTSSQAAPNYYWAFMLYTGSEDIEIFRISILNGFGGTLTADSEFEIQEIAADTAGPILELVKNRIANNGQVLDGDTVGEVRLTGRTNTGTDPVVAYLKFTATDNMTTSAYGGTFTMYSTKDATASISEHLKFIGGQVETAAAHKLNSLRFVSQNVATAASIAALNSDYRVVEMTGATATDIHGIDATGDSQLISIHNRSSANVTLKHQSLTASASDRLKLPQDADQVIVPEETITLYYCTTDARWKVKDAVRLLRSISLEKLESPYQQWTAPTGVSKVKIRTFRSIEKSLSPGRMLDPYGNLYAWGDNGSGFLGQLGDGTTAAKSSPVAVLGGHTFKSFHRNDVQMVGVRTDGTVYAWGAGGGAIAVGDTNPRSSPVLIAGPITKFSSVNVWTNSMFMSQNGQLFASGDYNTKGELGVGDTTRRSSPVAVVGGLQFSKVIQGGAGGVYSTYAITKDGALYAWGNNGKGQLGVGDVTARSSPVAVVGGITFKKISVGANFSTFNTFAVGIALDGTLYAWGDNTNGQLGVGDVTARSSPVAVLGGLTFKDVSAYSTFVVGVTIDGDLYAWGNNSDGQLGVGDVTPRSSPVAVLGGLEASKVIAGLTHVTALTTGGDLYAWGLNSSGLGNGSTVCSSPIAVLGGLKFADISYPWNCYIGLASSGGVYSWGDNSSGQIGDGSVSNRASPVLLIGAFGPASPTPVSEVTIPVTAGQTYDVVLSMAQSTFGSTPIGSDIDYITIAYEN